jgi:leucine dehydrogenase
MELLRMETSHVVGISRALGGSGDPSPVTALGCFAGMKACIEEKLGKSSFEGLRVAVQGAGHVGYHVVGHLVRAGAKVVVCDVDEEAIKNTVNDFRVEAVNPDEIYDVDCDIFAPCAMGGIVNHNTIPRLKCSIIAGAANNQLGEEKGDGARLADRDILYAPDFVINAGGLINVANELEGYNQERALSQAEGIYDILRAVFERAKKNNVPTYRAANNVAMDRIEAIGRTRRTYTGHRHNIFGPGSLMRGVS